MTAAIPTATPTAHDVLTQSAFAAVLEALSRPGTIAHLPQPGLAQLVETLVDRDTTVWCEMPELRGALSRAGARHVPLAEAEHVFLSDAAQLPGAIPALAAGSALYPDLGATVILGAVLEGGPRLAVSGPGIRGTARIAPGLPAAVWPLRDARAAYPAGFEILLVEDDRIMALPRSTRVEVI